MKGPQRVKALGPPAQIFEEKERGMKKNTRKLQLSRETLTTLTVEQNKLAAGGLAARDNSRQPQLPATSDSAKVCCA
jgi:hypothetical protein